MTKNIRLLALILLAALAACSAPKKEEETGDTEEIIEEVPEITLSKVTGSPEYPDASLQMIEPGDDPLDTGTVSFSFQVGNYELGAQTADAAEKGLANSGKGQHIHLIVDNGPYSAHYEPNFTKEFEEGSYVVLAFLSRSYHESVKNGNAFVVKQITVGNPSEVEAVDFGAPHMFYSRPKGTYSGEDTKKVLLDFYLLNTELSADGNKVKATINGSEFIIDEWTPYQIEGLPIGEATIKLELIDAAGNPIPGPFNTVERKVTLTE